MPIIQLLRPEATAKPGAPVLDTQRRPTVNNGAVASAVGELANAQRQPGVPMELAKNGLGAVGDALAQAGSVIGALAIKRKQAESDIQIAEADAAMTVKMSDFDRIKAENPNPAKWEPEFRKGFVEFREGLLANEDLNDGAREAIKLRLVRFEGQALASVASQATTKTFALAQSATQANLDRYTEAQDEAGFVQTLDHGAKSGYLFPHQVEAAKQQFQREGERQTKQREANAKKAEYDLAVADAITAPREWLETNGDTPWKGKEQLWARTKNVADERDRENAASAIRGLNDKMRDGSITVAAEIDAWEDPGLTPELREHAKELFNQRAIKGLQRADIEERIDKQENGVRNAVEMRHKVMDYDPSKDPSRKGYFSLLNEIGSRVEQSAAGEITGELYRKYGSEPPKSAKPSSASDMVFKDALKAAFDPVKGIIPWKALPSPKWKDAAGKEHVTYDDDAKRAAAVDAEVVIRQEYEDWARLNPAETRDPAKVRAKVMELIPEVRKAGFLEGLQKKLPQRTSAISPRGFEPVDIAPKLPVALRPHAQDFLDAAKEYGLNPRFLAAVSALETGGGTSRAFREKNNAMGISDNSGPVAMDSVRDSIFKQAKTLARADGPYRNAQTIDEIGAIYAPPGASNDPRGTNGGWSDGVKAWLARI